MTDARDLWDLAHSRRITRELAPADVPPATLERILEIARWAPSPFNAQPWRYVIVRERLAGLWDAIEEAGLCARKGRPTAKFLERLELCRRAGLAIFVFLDQDAVQELFATHAFLPYERLEAWCVESMGMAQMLLWLALTEEGLAVSLQNFEDEEKLIAHYLGVPYARLRLFRVLVIGRPAAETPPTGRLPLDELVCYERWPAAPAEGEE